jgi:hypothetical protein
MDVKIEGQNVPRHLDFTTSNHGSPPNEGVVTPSLGTAAAAGTDADKEKCECCGKEPHSANQTAGNEISEAEFYSPKPANGPPPHFAAEAAALLKEVRAGPCKNLLPPANPSSKTKCNKDYIATPAEKRGIEEGWNHYRITYYKKFKIPPLPRTSVTACPRRQAGARPARGTSCRFRRGARRPKGGSRRSRSEPSDTTARSRACEE